MITNGVCFPRQDRYREIGSVSNTMDFQSRRAKIIFKDGSIRIHEVLKSYM